jgi:tellurite resistance protein TehA-like permease
MALRPGAGTALVLSAVVVAAGVFVLATAGDSPMGFIGWLLIGTGVLFVVLNVMLLRRDR